MVSQKVTKTKFKSNVNEQEPDDLRLRLEEWRANKRQKVGTHVPGSNKLKRYTIGQPPPPVPKSTRKVQAVSKIDSHWKKRRSSPTDNRNNNISSLKKVPEKKQEGDKKPTISFKTKPSCSLQPLSKIRPVVAINSVSKQNNNGSSKLSLQTSCTTNNDKKTIITLRNQLKSTSHQKSNKRLSLRSIKSRNCVRKSSSTSLKHGCKENLKPVSSEEDLAKKIDVTPFKHVTFQPCGNKPGPNTSHSKKCLSQQNGQVSIRKSLKNWLDENEKTPSRFRHLMCFDAQMSSKKVRAVAPTKPCLTVDELTQQQETLINEERNINRKLGDIFDGMEDDDDHVFIKEKEAADTSENTINQQLLTMLDECFTLFLAGCPVDSILPWLDRIQKNIPIANISTTFYICKLNVVKSTGNNKKIMAVIDEAIRNGAKPADKLADVVTSTIKEMLESKEHKTDNGTDVLTTDNIFDSMAIKYSIKQVTPFTSNKKRKRISDGGVRKFSPRTVVTPVRRSTRRSASFVDVQTDKVYVSLKQMTDEERGKALFQTNVALGGF
ncbi:uncharacterized protein LOC126830211 [Patella vulgata]|uniref:uncharacterized protein LOC126830211 n=1 Tax=Patella vulgata TaxID=6465 RepID=UPI002180530C|nr:uncharacterized protein LOC126830211 [Patella vulgata]